MNILSKLTLEGFRSIKSASFELRPLTVMIGANGAGKSNLIDFLRMLNYALSRGFQNPYLVERGPASAVLHFGAKTTPLIRAALEFSTEAGTNIYRFSLADSAGDTLSFTREEVQFHRAGAAQPTPAIPVIPRPRDHHVLKASHAYWVATEVGLERMRARCPRFRIWMEDWETWGMA